MNLYFLGNDDKQHLIERDVNEDSAAEKVVADVKKRRTEGTILGTRIWWDKYFRMWIEIDFGKTVDLYILQNEKTALNVVEDESEKNELGHVCNGDYCSI